MSSGSVTEKRRVKNFDVGGFETYRWSFWSGPGNWRCVPLCRRWNSLARKCPDLAPADQFASMPSCTPSRSAGDRYQRSTARASTLSCAGRSLTAGDRCLEAAILYEKANNIKIRKSLDLTDDQIKVKCRKGIERTISRCHRSFKSNADAESARFLCIRGRELVANRMVYYSCDARKSGLFTEAVLLFGRREVDGGGHEAVALW